MLADVKGALLGAIRVHHISNEDAIRDDGHAENGLEELVLNDPLVP